MQPPRHPPSLAAAAVLVAGPRGAVWLTPDGEVETMTPRAAVSRLADQPPPLVCHARATAKRLGVEAFPALDVLELFAFTRPAEFALPTPRGLTEVLGLALPGSLEAAAVSLRAAAHLMLDELNAASNQAEGDDGLARAIAWAMARNGWSWGPSVLAAVGGAAEAPSGPSADGYRIWRRLPEWSEPPPPPPADNQPVSPREIAARLKELLGSRAEKRTEQRHYAASCGAAFAPRNRRGEPQVVLAEAGTGVGKTLGYIAPASLWAEKNQATVWISTFTRNLQRQLDDELDRLYPNPVEKRQRVVIRKGRENYLCLLNLAEAVGRLPARPRKLDLGAAGGVGDSNAVALGLVARWASATRDGDLLGGDFPSWLLDLLDWRLAGELTDTRGECIYSACDHYRKCFIEHTQRRARDADIVVANHALVLIQAALSGLGGGDGDDGAIPGRYVFDEGHHLFDAADSAFSAHLSGRETADLRRWLLGAGDGGRARGRAKGLDSRARDLITGDAAAEEALDETLRAAHALPGAAWGQRVSGGQPMGPAEAFLALVHQQVYARDQESGSAYSLETETANPVPGLLDAAGRLDGALDRLEKPLTELIKCLAKQFDDEAADLDTQTRSRIDGLIRSITRRGLQPVAAWRAMLRALGGETPPEFADWFAVERAHGRDVDVGYRRHWIDPTAPLAKTVFERAQGVLITSATLRDPGLDNDEGWKSAQIRTGAGHLPGGARQANHPSPFDYANRTRILVVGDVNRNDPDQVAAAYRELFLASGGGGLGLFTAISRLRGVHQRIVEPLDAAGIGLLAQHVDAMDTGTLVDIFRAEEDFCLLGTDAVRDGVDVPGRSLRLIVFDRVPWPRPDILHRARRAAFGGRTHDEMLARLKLKQAYGRLIRRATDKGVFVMLDRSLPTRLTTAFPEGVEIQRLGLNEALAETRAFLAEA